MQQLWTLSPPITPSPELQAAVAGHPLVARLLLQRGIDTPERARAFLDPAHYTPAPPTALWGLNEAGHLLLDAIQTGRNILVWGDFDVDGQTSTSLLVAALRELTDSDRIRYHVPNRFAESHGIRLDSLKPWLTDPAWTPHLLLTCDTGIAEAEAVTYAKAHGLTVVITDHHDLTEEFRGLIPGVDALWGKVSGGAEERGSPSPSAETRSKPGSSPPSVRCADAIVNPKFQPTDDPLRTLPGVGVAYKLIQHLYALAGHAGEEEQFLDLVALGIVADVAEQVHDARYLLQKGLERLRNTKRVGLLALMNVARLDPATVSADSIGFQLGPRMNALGRLEDATVSVELLTTRDPIRAGQLAAKMERLNQQRRLLTSQTTAVALEMIERTPNLLDYNGLVLAHPNWHAGIVGIVAARLVEEFGKPTILLLNPPGQAARGSARSIPSVDIGASIAACSQMLLTHGGHPGAAGVSLAPENIDRFRRELDRQIDLHRIEGAPEGIFIDAELNLREIDLTLIEEIQRLAPFGNGNPTPQFMSRGLRIVDDRRLGHEGQHRKFTVQPVEDPQSENGPRLPVLWFNHNDAELPSDPLDLAYTLNINEYRGERSVQLMYVTSRTAEDSSVAALATITRQIHDLRTQAVQLDALPTPVHAVWYAEGALLERGEQAAAYAPRTAIPRTSALETMVLWSIPPSSEVLTWLVERVQPRAVYICGQHTADDSLDGLLRNVAGMCKYALARGEVLHVDRLAARLGTTEAVIRHSLLWLEAKGLITLTEWLEGDQLRITTGDAVDRSRAREALQSELDAQLAEVRAYRRFFRRVKVGELRIG